MRPTDKQVAGQGAEPKATGDEAAIRAAFTAYLTATTNADFKGVLAFWATDADYIDEAGKMTRGKEQIGELFKKSLPQRKGIKISGKLNSIKFLRPEVCLVDGSIEFTEKDGIKESGRYAVVWTKSGDKWLISSVRDLPSEVTDLPSMSAAQLQGLEWLVGEWHDDGAAKDVVVSIRWDTNKAFLLMNYSVKNEGADPLLVTMRIGWDPIHGRVRSWTFDSNGGFGEGFWTKDGKKWVVGTSGVLPDGGTGGATLTYEFVDANTFVWKATDRDIDDQPLADAEVKFVRKAAK
jgi:uncharacterized protein (TIGR02246 family)